MGYMSGLVPADAPLPGVFSRMNTVSRSPDPSRAGRIGPYSILQSSGPDGAPSRSLPRISATGVVNAAPLFVLLANQVVGRPVDGLMLIVVASTVPSP